MLHKYAIRRETDIYDMNEEPLCPWPDAILEYAFTETSRPIPVWTIELGDLFEFVKVVGEVIVNADYIPLVTDELHVDGEIILRF